MIRLALCASLLLVSLSVPTSAKTKNETGFLDRSISVDGTTYKFQVYVPAEWNPKEKWPVLLALHGYGERGDNGMLQTDVGFGHAIRTTTKPIPFLVVMPQCRDGDHFWTEPAMEAQALAALDQSVREFNGDSSRVYLTGLSMGGYGTWNIAARHPRKFAAYVPVCGGILPNNDHPAMKSGFIGDRLVKDPYAETARRIGKTPVWIFHGADDPTVPVDESRKMAEALRAVGGNVKYSEYPGVSHNSWDKAYAEPDLFPWLLQQKLR